LTLDKDISKQLAAFETKVLSRMFEGIELNNKAINEELMQLFGDLDIL